MPRSMAVSVDIRARPILVGEVLGYPTWGSSW